VQGLRKSVKSQFAPAWWPNQIDRFSKSIGEVYMNLCKESMKIFRESLPERNN